MSQRIRIQFSNSSVEADYHPVLIKFLDTLAQGSAKNEDIRIFSTFFQLQWPATFYPAMDKFVGYNVVNYA